MTSQRVRDLTSALRLEEKASLTAGRDLWSTAPVERLGIPAVGLTDGPNGARGMGLPGVGVIASACTPCGAGLGASWDIELLERVGALIGREARAKGCHVLLAPTVNIHRSPLGGRTFEAFSEDPLLSGALAVAYIRGVQSEGVAAAVKHLAGNESERERMTADSLIDERTLREIYLLPFEMAVRDGDVRAVMTAYNRLNGVWCGENAPLLGILRQEWGFEGVVMTDWFAGVHTVTAMNAGLNLEMPGPGRAFGPAVAAAVTDGALDDRTVSTSIEQLLEMFDRAGVFDPPGRPAVDQPEDRALLRRAASAASVLLTNDGVLPLALETLDSIAVLGPNAARTQIAGGGSAQVRPYHRASILDALRERAGDRVRVHYARGCSLDSSPPVCEGRQLRTPGGSAGLLVECFAGTQLAGDPAGQITASDTQLAFTEPPVGGLDMTDWSLRASGTFTPLEDGEHRWSLSQAGRARLYIDGALLLDGTVDPPGPGTHFFGMGSADLEASIPMAAGRNYAIAIELTSEASFMVMGFRVGCQPVDVSDLMDRAESAAAQADVAIVVVGTNDEWETEGRDRESLSLPGEQDALVRRVAAVNPRTVVLVNTGSPVALPWAGDVAAVLHVSFGGQEMGEGVVDVLAGAADPGGRLATTFPLRLPDTPAFTSFAPENHVVRYTEGVFVGYRWYDSRQITVGFPFGHGLSYGSTTWGEPVLSSTTIDAGVPLRIELTVSNAGDRAATDVVQCYVVPLDAPVRRPHQELKAFAKVELPAGGQSTVQISLDERAFSYWHTGDGHAIVGEPLNDLAALGGTMAAGIGIPSGRARGWLVAPGEYDIVLARSSADAIHRLRVRAAGQ
ncbi:MAG TPA: glycoside hydrolase family 3 C-terminal domain-containing protein [Frankiaceae bacterium]|nr:glycoside hydrolase family 3 C-terminal domain-containing protein [Frankiaceae bacterium]